MVVPKEIPTATDGSAGQPQSRLAQVIGGFWGSVVIGLAMWAVALYWLGWDIGRAAR